MIQLPTVSAPNSTLAERSRSRTSSTLLAELYPLVHEHLELERITEFGLLFRWAGGDGIRSARSC